LKDSVEPNSCLDSSAMTSIDEMVLLCNRQRSEFSRIAKESTRIRFVSFRIKRNGKGRGEEERRERGIR
jgi:hypothetical protein